MLKRTLALLPNCEQIICAILSVVMAGIGDARSVFAQAPGKLDPAIKIQEQPLESQDIEVIREPSPDRLIWHPASSPAAKIVEHHIVELNSVRFSPDERFLAAVTDGSVMIFDANSWQVNQKLPASNPWCMVAWSPGSKEVAFSDTENSVTIASVDGATLFRLKNLPARPLRIEWSPDGELLAIGGDHGSLAICNIAQKVVVENLKTEDETIWRLSFSKENSNLAIRTQGESLFLWNRRNNTTTRIAKDLGLNGILKFSRNSDRYAMTHKNNEVGIYDAVTHVPRTVVSCGYCSQSEWSKDDRLLILAGNEQISICDSFNGKTLLQFRGTAGYVRSVSLAPGRQLLSAVDSNSQLVVWDVSSIDELRKATTFAAPEVATVSGRYSDLISIYTAPRDETVFGPFCEFGLWTESEHQSGHYWIYSAPNWYVFEKSRIGMYRPPSPLPEPALLADGRRMIWLAFPNAICRSAFADAVAQLSMQIPEIATAELTYRHRFQFPDKDRNFAVALLAVEAKPNITTEQLLERLARVNISVRDGTILSGEQAKNAGIGVQFREP